VALRAFERLDRRLFVDRQNDGAIWRSHVETDDLGGLGHEVGIVALAPGFAAGKIDLLRTQKAPDMLDMDVAESLCQQRPSPVGVASRRLLVEQSQNTRIVLRPIFRLRAATRSPVSSSPAMRLAA